jgi:DNA-binding transcriptional LysR family regulator
MTTDGDRPDQLRAPSLPNLTLQQLTYLREMDRSNTVTAAAQTLGVSQPALSQALVEIERRLDVTLFERRSRRLELTEAGRRTVNFAREILGHAESLERWLAGYREGRAGSLRVGMIDAASLYVLPAAVRQFRRQHPNVELQLTVDRTAHLLDQLRRSDVDLAFVVGPIAEAFLADDFIGTDLREEPLYLYGPPEDTDPELGDWVLYPTGRQTRALIDEGLARQAIRPHVTLESDSPDVLRQLVALGLGWSVLPEGVAEIGPQPLTRFSDEPIAQRTLLALRRAGTDADPRVDAFLALALGANQE